MTVPTDSIVDPTPEPSAPESPATEQPAAEPDKDWEAEAAKWKALARKHENANASSLKELEQLRIAQMSETDKAIAEAEKRGRDAALKELRADMARAKLQAQAAGKVADVEALLEVVDVSRFLKEDGIDEEAIAATIERLTKVAPAQPAPPKFGSVELGPQGDRPRQLGEADLTRMTPEQIVEARSKGQLDDLLGVTS
jgi:hypothetical protein